jgi:2-polyprenyl-6-hydroxyphenyl methylase / 3-demethylubiquinone-9 3-methyltransferase
MKYTRFSENRNIEEGKKIFESRIKDAKLIYKKFGSNFQYRPCPICAGNDYVNIEKFINRYDVCKCNICNSDFVNPIPNMEALSYYYNNCENNKLYSKLNLKRQKSDFRLDSRINFIKQYIQKIISENKERKLNILEIGCNNGTFLSLLNEFISSIGFQSKIDLYGIDIDENVIRNSVDNSLNLNALPAEKIGKLNVKFDIILHFELIEHLNNPISFMNAIYENLFDGGYVIFTTPNSLGLEIKALGYNKTRLLAHSIFPPMHLNAFSTENILLFANKNNFKLKSIETPGILDIDILSLVSDEIEDENLYEITNMNEDIKAYFQFLTSYLNSSSHMRVVFEK